MKECLDRTGCVASTVRLLWRNVYLVAAEPRPSRSEECLEGSMFGDGGLYPRRSKKYCPNCSTQRAGTPEALLPSDASGVGVAVSHQTSNALRS